MHGLQTAGLLHLTADFIALHSTCMLRPHQILSLFGTKHTGVYTHTLSLYTVQRCFQFQRPALRVARAHPYSAPRPDSRNVEILHLGILLNPGVSALWPHPSRIHRMVPPPLHHGIQRSRQSPRCERGDHYLSPSSPHASRLLFARNPRALAARSL